VARLFISDHPSLFKIKCNFNTNSDEYFITREMRMKDIQTLNGVYLFHMKHDYKNPNFVICLETNYITILITYGGVLKVFMTEFPRLDWLNLLDNFFSKDETFQAEHYHELWRLESELCKPVTMLIIK
jgi:hypothetical protein